jgi:Cu-processing system permease protein
MDLGNIAVIAAKELQDAARNRWMVLYAAVFAIVSLAVASMGLSGIGGYGLAGFGRTAAGLVNLVLLIAPLMGLTMGALSIASERERGTLLYLQAQPVNGIEVLLGKYLGMALALFGALALGFGASGVLIAWRAGATQAFAYLTLAGLAYLLALASLSTGFLLSTLVRKGATAAGMALFAWLLLAFFGDLGLMSTAVVMKLDVQLLFALTLANPLQVFKTASILLIQGGLDVLGPAGVYALRTYSSMTLTALLLGVMALWILAPLATSYVALQRKGGL